MNEPLVSVITPTYNRPHFLESVIQTVQDQTYENIEHIIIDDHSDIPISDLLSDKGSSVIIQRHSTNKGANAARNTGINIASGEYIAFLDDDDQWHPTKIEKQIDKAKETGSRAIYTGIKEESNGDIFSTRTPSLRGQITRDLLTGGTLNSTSVMMFHSTIFEQVGGFDEKLPINQDWEFCVRVSKVVEFEPITEPLVTRYHHESQISDNYTDKHDIVVPRIWEKHKHLAEDLGVKREFRASQQSSLGDTAVRCQLWGPARYHYLCSMLLSPSVHNVIRFLATMFGRWSYKPAQKISRTLR